MDQNNTEQSKQNEDVKTKTSEEKKRNDKKNLSFFAHLAKRVFRSTNQDVVRSFAQILFLVFFNIGVLVGMFVILGQLPMKAQELQELKNKQLRMETGSDARVVEQAITRYKNKIETLEQAIPDDKGMLVFIEAIDRLREQGIIRNFKFASESSVKDRLGYEVLPVTIELVGNEDELNVGLQALSSLPSILRSVTFELEYLALSENYRIRIGGVLYVSGFAENK